MSETDDEQSFDEFEELTRESYEKAKTAKELEKEEIKLQKIQEKEAKKQAIEQAKEQKRFFKEQQRLIKEEEKEAKKAEKKAPKMERVSFFAEKEDDDNDLFSDVGTEIQGREKMILLKKVSQFKQLFPERLRTFKIKKNANEEDLKLYLDEMESIVEINNLDQFMYDSILQSIKIVESASAMTRNYNIKGLADMLSLNPQFQNLCKLMFIKYHVFSAVPVEYQIMICVTSTAAICMQKNRQTDKINEYLNQKI